MTDSDTLRLKLEKEIKQLERWLETQSRSDRSPGNPVASTIEELIRTRQNLLESLTTSET
ncbi:MAG: hypothetical protein JKY67_07880 [Pseudomonadales bacterium]|nr:hypothetical protein [Pseudomonadales bacterium]